MTRYNNYYLPKYSFGSWLNENAGMVGTIAGTGIGAAIGGPAGAGIGASIGGSIGGTIQGKYEQELSAEEQEALMIEMTEKQAFQNKINMATQNLNNNNLQQKQFAGTQRFANGGKLDPRMPKSVGQGVSGPSNISIPSGRAMELYQAKLFGDAYDPMGDYRHAVDRGLTSTTQDFIYDRAGTRNPYEASINETISTPPTELYSGDEEGVSRLIPTSKIDLGKATEAQQFLTDMHGRGQIKYAHGGMLTKYDGQTHAGPDGGIAVDGNGNPTASTGQEPVGLVEDGEVSWEDPNSGQAYVFSNRLIV